MKGGNSLVSPLCHLLLLLPASWHRLLSPGVSRGVSRCSSLVIPIYFSKSLSDRSFVWEASCWHPEYMSQSCSAPSSSSSTEELLTDDSSCPPSILRKRPPVDQAAGEKRKAERRVRFREPEEVIEHAISCCDYVVGYLRPTSLTDPQGNVCVCGCYYDDDRFQRPQPTSRPYDMWCLHDRSSAGLPVFLWLSFCAVLILAASLYYTSMKKDFKVLEEFQSQLVIFFVQIRHIAQKCWTWFTRQ